MATVYLGIGSNINVEKNLRLGVRALQRLYGNLRLSPVYKSAPLGFDGDDFLNLVVELQTDDTPQDIHEQIEIIHKLSGRERGSDPFLSRPLDIDLLMYDDLVSKHGKIRLPRDDVLDYSFVLRPLAELAPMLRHPETGKTMQQHWQLFETSSHPLVPVDVIL